MTRQKDVEEASTGRSFKIPLLYVTCILLLISSTISAYDIKRGGNQIDVDGRGNNKVKLLLKNSTGKMVGDVYVKILTNNTLEITGMDSSHERLDRVDDDRNEELDEDEVDPKADKPGKDCRLIFYKDIATSDERGNSTELTITFNTNPPRGTKLKVIFSIKKGNGHLNILANTTISPAQPGSVFVPMGTKSAYTSVINNTGGLIKSINFRVKGNTFKRIMPGKRYGESEVRIIGGYARVDLVPPLPASESVDIYFWLDRPAADDRTVVMVSDKEPQYWPSPKIVCPTVAISRGTIIGTVINPENNRPLPDIYISTGTTGGLTGTVINSEGIPVTDKYVSTDTTGVPRGTVIDENGQPLHDIYVSTGTTGEVEKTDDNGRFEFNVPAGTSLTVSTVGLTGEIKTKIISEDELDFPGTPPEFISPGEAYTVIGNYPLIKYQSEENEESYWIPEARSVSRDGRSAITTIASPPDITLGKGRWIMTNTRGINRVFESIIYRMLSSWIDQARLISGQITTGVYRFDFGRTMANQTLWIEIETKGAIRLLGRTGPRPFTTDSYGRVTVEFRVQAVRGKGTTFAINYALYRSRR